MWEYEGERKCAVEEGMDGLDAVQQVRKAPHMPIHPSDDATFPCAVSLELSEKRVSEECACTLDKQVAVDVQR